MQRGLRAVSQECEEPLRGGGQLSLPTCRGCVWVGWAGAQTSQSVHVFFNNDSYSYAKVANLHHQDVLFLKGDTADIGKIGLFWIPKYLMWVSSNVIGDTACPFKKTCQA